MFFALEPALATLSELDDHERAALHALLPGPVTLLLANPRLRFGRRAGPTRPRLACASRVCPRTCSR